jgi:hypothetical protein
MWRCFFAALVALVQPLGAQIRPALEVSLSIGIRVMALGERPQCAIGTAVDQIARQTNVLVGIEHTRDCETFGWTAVRPDDEVLTGLSVRQALDHVIARVPSYRWAVVDDVVVVRPAAAWDDATSPLNLPTARFSATQAHLHDVLHTLIAAVTPQLSKAHTDVTGNPPWPIDRPVSVTFSGGTLLDALNTVIRAHGHAEWRLGYVGGSPVLSLSTLDLEGGVVSIPIALPGSPRDSR